LGDFKSHEEALALADQLVGQNQQEMGHNEPAQEHDNALLTRVYYIHGQGKKRALSQAATKELAGGAEVKSAKQVADSASFIEVCGLAVKSSSSSCVKVENVAHSKMSAQREILKYSSIRN